MNATTETRRVDNALRSIAKHAGNGDSTNPSASWMEIRILATFGAGTNSTLAQHGGDILYEANDYGNYVTAFRPGKWVERVFAYADQVTAVAEAIANEAKRKSDAEKTARFAPIDF